MKAIYLKFPSPVDLSEYEGRDVEGISVDIVGTLYNYVDENTPPVALDGWHVNMLVPDDFDVFAEWEVSPTSPRRVFAGW